MNLRELYLAINGDFDSAISLLRKEERIEKYLTKYLESEDYINLESAVKDNTLDKIFLYSHSMKGFAGNLGLSGLYKASSDLCEATRDGNTPTKNELQTMFKSVSIEQLAVINAMNSFK